MAPRCYLLHGPDEFAAAEFLEGLKAQLGDPSLVELNTTAFDGRSVMLAELRAICDTLPFLAPRRLVVVDGWLAYLQGKGEAAEGAAGAAEGAEPARASRVKETLAELVAYLPALPESTALVLWEKRALPERHPVVRAAATADWGLVRLFDLPKGEALVRWIRARARSLKGELTPQAASALAEVDDDPRGLANEIAKLLAYVDYARPVELEDVQRLTPAGGEAIIFDLVDAMGQRRASVAMRELHKLLDTEEPLYVLAMIVRQYRLLLQSKELLLARASEAEVAQTLRMGPYPAKKVCAQARNFSLAELEHIYHRLLDYDLEIKTGQIEPGAALDTLVGALAA